MSTVIEKPGTPVVLMPDGLYRWDAIADRIPLSRESWRLRIHEGRAPKGVVLGPRCTAWRGADVIAWLADPAGYRQPPEG